VSNTNAVYRDRAVLTAHMAAVYPSVIVHGADPYEPEWAVVYITLPTGQISYHISPADLDLFTHVRVAVAADWDGHTTDEKNRRLAEYTELISERRDAVATRFTRLTGTN
jgi:hypothetical protein